MSDTTVTRGGLATGEHYRRFCTVKSSDQVPYGVKKVRVGRYSGLECNVRVSGRVPGARELVLSGPKYSFSFSQLSDGASPLAPISQLLSLARAVIRSSG